ncbi:DUF4129 domain-containing protein [Amnibacterium endophyticum]|uniref:DUF4129 domain-containing protein n=1 Tax=Amnibacterium endophyticum TaxID=2109337 RepID=A0ABW4LAS5_9MICO
MTVPVLATVPVAPDGDAARRLLLDELAKPEYAAAQPTLFDRVATAFLDWFTGLFDASRSGAPPLLLAIALALLVVALVVALLLFGVPRFNRRGRAAAGLFGDDDSRTADELRRAAAAALARGDFDAAVLDRFRALARGLDERTLVALFPGTTAVALARAAADPFPQERGPLRDAAVLFDGVRYAGRSATREDAEGVAGLDDRLAAARPLRDAPVPA